MTHDLIHGSSSDSRFGLRGRRSRPETPKQAPPELPVVIRPTPLLLAEVEQRVHQDGGFARLLLEEPVFRGTVARAILARDAAAKLRFDSAEALADHLHQLRIL